MDLRSGNLLAPLPDAALAEAFETLLAAGGVRIERIVSAGQSSPPDFWYDEPRDEWVAVLSGSADLLIAGEAAPRRLSAGDHLLIPAHCRHRVERTENPTIWLAVHVAGICEPGRRRSAQVFFETAIVESSLRRSGEARCRNPTSLT